MKTIFTLMVTAAVAFGATFNTAAQNNDTKEAEAKKVSILGDSYSTFAGHNPEGYAPFYPNDRNDVTKVEETWWDLYINAMGYELEANNSWGGTTICNTGYGRMDSSSSAFTSRVDMLGNPDIIFVFGGTNDAWAGSPIGEYQYEGWTKEDCKSFRPALACLFDQLREKYPQAQIYSILNSELREEINESSRTICKHYGIQLIELHDIEKQNGHPSIKGMKSICDQLIQTIGSERLIKPAGTWKVPDISKAEYERMYKGIDNGSSDIDQFLETNPIYEQFYTPACSWYCGGSVNNITASSCLKPQGTETYDAENLHDFNHESAWAEGVKGNGIGEYIIYEFPGNCPRVTTVNILNGYVRNEKLWRENSRVRKLKLYYNDTPIGILELEDSRTLQWFDVGILGNGLSAKETAVWTLKFEILEVYPGTRHKDTVISEIYFDGIDVH